MRAPATYLAMVVHALPRPLGTLALALAACTGAPTETPPGPPPPPLCDPSAAVHTGPTPLRRLTRAELANTVRDLLGVEVDRARLPHDEKVGSFASNSVTPLSRVDVEELIEVSESVADRADLSQLADCDLLVTPASECAARFVARIAPLAYRRPVTPEERDGLLALYATIGATDHRGGLRLVLRALLQSPHFVYHVELARTPGDDVAEPVLPIELASRLSYFLWRSMPDEALTAAALAGELETSDQIRAQAERMLADPKAARAVAEFHLEWLGLDTMDTVAKDPLLYPDFTPEVRRAMVDETTRFADYVIREGDAELGTLLTASFSFLEGPLFAWYGVAGSAPARVELDPSQRFGILTHASVLSRHSHYQRSSLTLRGKLVREDFFCEPLPDPPPNVDITLPELGPNATTRERVEAHQAPGCASCHRLIDDVGFAFETYDAVGRWRTTENGTPVDTSGSIAGTDVEGEYDGARELVTRLSESEDVRECVARQWFRFAHARGETAFDGCALQAAFDAMNQPRNLRELILALVTSDAFRWRRR